MKIKKIIALIFSLACFWQIASAQTTTTPKEVDLLWEAETSVPAHFPGLSRPSAGSRVRVVAIPALGNVAATQVDYQWEKDGKKISSISGVGKNTLTYFAGSAGSENLVRVTAIAPGAGARASAAIKVLVATPEILWYEDRSDQGERLGLALGERLRLGFNKFPLLAEPYYFPQNAAEETNLIFRWSSDGQTITSNPARPGLLSLVPPEIGGGETTINLLITSSEGKPLSAERNLVVNFGNEEL